MKTFSDTTGREWAITLNVAAMKRVRELCEVDLIQVVDNRGKLLQQLIADPILLCNVIYVVCKSDADRLKITDEQFGENMSGDAIEDATNALLEELINFFPAQKREILQAVFQKMRTFETKAAEYAQAKLNSPEMDAQLNAVLEETLGDAFGNAPESSA